LFGVVFIGRFYHHYFIQLVAPLALACGYAAALIPFRVRFLTLGASAYLYFHAIIDQKLNYFVLNPENNCRDIEEVASFIKTHSKSGEPLFLYQNSALCLYYLSERFPPMKVFMYAQMLPENKDGPALLEEGLRRWKRNPPKLVVTGALSYRIPQIEALIERDFSSCTNIGIFRIHKRKAEEPKLANDRPQ
jgi:hypothetical protein